MEKRKAMVFFSSGLGDALLLVPLLNALKNDGFEVTGFFNSTNPCEALFSETTLLDKIIVKPNKIDLISFAMLNNKKFDCIYLNHQANSRSNQWAAAELSDNVYLLGAWYTKVRHKQFHFNSAKANIHDALQNAWLYNKELKLSDLDFSLHYTPTSQSAFQIEAPYLVLQHSSGNNQTPYKNWDEQKWLALFKHIATRLPNYKIVLLGDKNEMAITNQISHHANVVSLIGQTTISDTISIVANAEFYVGLDSAFMHLAFLLDKPTFSIWGGSSPTLYSYEWKDPKQHKVVSLHLDCAPCNAWVGPNATRVTNPLKCPDFNCVKDLSLEMVIEAFDYFIIDNAIEII
jgi:ADP-heptose:LPS heptosyltransferase